MAQAMKSGDVAGDASAKGSIVSILLAPIMAAVVKLVDDKTIIDFPVGYDAMLTMALGAGVIKLYMYARMRAYLVREQQVSHDANKITSTITE